MAQCDAGMNLKVKVLDEQLDKLESRIEKISKRGIFGSGDSKQLQAAQKRQKQLEEAAATERRLAKARAESVDIANRGTLKKLKAEEQYRKELQSTIEEIRKRNRLIQQQEANRNQFPGGVNNPLPFTRAGQGKVRSSVDRLEAKRNEQLKQRQKLARTIVFQTKLEYELARKLPGVQRLITKEQQNQISAGQSLQKQKERALKAAEREAKLAERTAAAEKKRAQRAGGRRLQSAALGVGFPLLFGGGAGSIAGGLLGSAGGFGGQILGSAIGAKLDEFAASAAKLGQALNPATADLDTIVDSLGIAGTATERYIQELDKSGASAEAAAIATQKLSELIGQDGVEALQEFGKDSQELTNELAKFFTQMQAGIADLINSLGILKAAIDGVGRTVTIEAARKARGQSDDLDAALDALAAERSSPKSGLQGYGIAALIPQAPTDAELKVLQEYRKILFDVESTVKGINGLTQQDINLQERKLTAAEYNLDISKNEKKIAELGGDITNDKVYALEKQNLELEYQLKIQDLLNEKAEDGLSIAIRKVKLQALANNRTADLAALEGKRNKAIASAVRRGGGSGVDKEAAVVKAISAEKAKQFELEVKLQTLGRTELDQVQIQLDNFDKITSLKRNQIVLATEDARVEAEKLQTLDLQRSIEREQLILRKQSLELAKKTQAVQARQSVDSLQRGLSQELAGIATPSSNQDLDARNAQALAQAQRYENALAGINDQLEVQRVRATSTDEAVSQAAEIRINQLERQKGVYEEMLPQIFAAEQAQLKFNQVLEAATPYAEAFATGLTQGLRDVVAGTKTAEEAFADFLNNIADLLVQTAAQMIAQYIAIGIARTFAGISSPSSGLNTSSFTGGFNPTSFVAGPFSKFGGTFAEGGTLGAGKWGIAGEAGPELISGPATITPMSGGGTVVNITVNSSGGSTSTSQGEKAKEAQALGRMVEASVVSIINREKRPGGILTR